MAQDHRLQPQRLELKYLVEETVAQRLRDHVRCHLELDSYAAGSPDHAYPIHSIYLDSDDLRTHHATVNGTRNRFKLRVRFYDDAPDTPVFFEIKARADDCVLKQRCGVRREAASLLLAGQLPEPEQLFSDAARHLVTLQKFIHLAQGLNARPRLHNCYRREAWVSAHDNSIRVTFDRDIRAEPFLGHRLNTAMHRPIRLFRGMVVLELKFTARYPNWFKQMAERFNLMRSASAKYSSAVELMGEQCFTAKYSLASPGKRGDE